MTPGVALAFRSRAVRMVRRSGCQGRVLEGDGVSESFELGDEPSGLAFGVAAGEVLAAEVVVELAGGEHVPDSAEHRVFDGAECAAVAELGFLAAVERLEVAVVGAQ